MKPATRISIVFLLLATLAGCAGSTAKVEQLQRLRVINIDGTVKMPDYGLHQDTAVPGVSINVGGATYYTVPIDGKTFSGFDDLLRKNNVSLPDMVLREFSGRLARSGRFKMGYPAEATLYLEVQTYGFNKTITFSLDDYVTRKFMLNIRGTLVDTKGEVIWQDDAYITALSDRLTTYHMDDIIDKPEVAQQAMQASVSIVANELIDKFLTIVINGS